MMLFSNRKETMLALKPDYFFNLAQYAHAAIFDGCVNVWDALDNLENYLANSSLGQIEVDVPAGAFLVNPELISIGKNTVIEPGAYIKGPCKIGQGCTIRHGAYIRGVVLTGDRCVIGHDTEIKNTIMLDGAQAAHFAYLGDSILGNDVNLGAGTKCANLKLDHKSIQIRVEGGVHQTNRRKLGAILGDKTQLGCNTVTNPGTLTGQGVYSYPCMNFGGFIPSGHTVQPSVEPVIKKRTHS